LEEARKKIFLIGLAWSRHKSRLSELGRSGFTCARRPGLQSLLLEAVNALKPNALIGVSAVTSSFTKEICEQMAAMNERPIIAL
jgi:malate dehydrogenase (oxaloacetate-decarboxylating)(NADP+)